MPRARKKTAGKSKTGRRSSRPKATLPPPQNRAGNGDGNVPNYLRSGTGLDILTAVRWWGRDWLAQGGVDADSERRFADVERVAYERIIELLHSNDPKLVIKAIRAANRMRVLRTQQERNVIQALAVKSEALCQLAIAEAQERVAMGQVQHDTPREPADQGFDAEKTRREFEEKIGKSS